MAAAMSQSFFGAATSDDAPDLDESELDHSQADNSWRRLLSFDSPALPTASGSGSATSSDPRKLKVFLRVRPLLGAETSEPVCLTKTSHIEVQIVAPEVCTCL